MGVDREETSTQKLYYTSCDENWGLDLEEDKVNEKAIVSLPASLQVSKKYLFQLGSLIKQ